MTNPDGGLGAFIATFRKGTEHLGGMVAALDIVWEPQSADLVRLHNNYVKNLIAAYTSKVHELCESILDALDHSHYLAYGLCGRTLIETVATLRYYNTVEYAPFVSRPQITDQDMAALIRLDDQHLRGSSFDWEAFFDKRFQSLRDAVRDRLAGAKNTTKNESDDRSVRQVRVGKTVKSWAAEDADVMIAYNLFCDLVHPNVGSNMLVATVTGKGLHFHKADGDQIGRRLIDLTFPLLVSVTQPEFGRQLSALARMQLVNPPTGA